jgi:predicted amidohydrolase YtcJ
MHHRAVLFTAALTAASGCHTPEPADLILTNGNVITVDAERPQVEALAVRGDRILAVGSNQEIEAYRGAETRVIDLEGETAVPGLIDAHLHFPRLGKRTKQLFLDETRSPEEAIAIVREQVESAEPGEWITGRGWHTVTWGSGYPDNEALSAVSPENPVFLIGMASHAVWVNAKALELAGITKDTPDPGGGRILRHPETGEPTGILLETARDLVESYLPPETRDTKKADIKLSVETAARLGLTEVHDAGVGDETIEIYEELLEEGELKVRLYVMYSIPDGGEVLDAFVQDPPRIGLGNHMLTLRSLKAFADGALGARGAALLAPYSDLEDSTGLVQNDEEELYKIVSKSMEAGYQVAVHAIGDRGNRMVLDAVARAKEAHPGADARVRIEHAQIVAVEDIPRFGELGVIPSMQPIHCTMDMGFAEARVGPERMKGAYAWKSLIDSGAILAASSDTPAFPVHYSNPIWGIYAAVTRQTNDGEPDGGWYPEEKVTRLDALKMYTLNAAYAAFEEDIKGTLTPGKLADVTVLSKDILSISDAEILDTEVVMTIVGGEVVYRNPSVVNESS